MYSGKKGESSLSDIFIRKQISLKSPQCKDSSDTFFIEIIFLWKQPFFFRNQENGISSVPERKLFLLW